MFPLRVEDMNLVADRVKEELHCLERYGYGPSETEWILNLLRRRLGGKPLRAYFVTKLSEYLLQGAAPLRRAQWSGAPARRLLERQLPLVFETVITVQYLHNQILDGKSGADQPAIRVERLLAANLLKEQLYRYLDGEVPAAWRERVVQAVRRTFELTDLGQRLDKQANSFRAFRDERIVLDEVVSPVVRRHIHLEAAAPFMEKIKRDLPELYHELVDVYFHRIYLTCAALFAAAADLLSSLLGAGRREAGHARSFAVVYGLMRQVVNDNADWLPAELNLSTHSRTAADAQSDLRNGLLTLPLIFYLAARQRGPIDTYLRGGGGTLTAPEQTAIFADLMQSNALFQSIQNGRILGELAMAHLDLARPAARFLVDTCEIVHWNKFLVPCLRHPAYKAYRKTSYYRRTRELIHSLRKPAPQPVPDKSWSPALARVWQALWAYLPPTAEVV